MTPCPGQPTGWRGIPAHLCHRCARLRDGARMPPVSFLRKAGVAVCSGFVAHGVESVPGGAGRATPSLPGSGPYNVGGGE